MASAKRVASLMGCGLTCVLLPPAHNYITPTRIKLNQPRTPRKLLAGDQSCTAAAKAVKDNASLGTAVLDCVHNHINRLFSWVLSDMRAAWHSPHAQRVPLVREVENMPPACAVAHQFCAESPMPLGE